MRTAILVAAWSSALFATANGKAGAQTPIAAELFSWVTGAVDLTFAPGDPTRLFVVEKGGRIFIIENGTLLSTPFLDIDPLVTSNNEQGLLGLAFHPNYMSNGRFFVNYTNNSGNTRIAEYVVSNFDPNLADPNGVQFIVQIDQPFPWHNGGCIKFGPDGKLYVGMGDGGIPNGAGASGSAQDPTQLLGKMLRFDVDIPAPFIPHDNPHVGSAGTREEIWHFGLRNPWRFTFDRGTGDMWIADVGDSSREEIDFIPAGVSDQNLGWRCMEGTLCTGLSGCSCANPILLDPIHEYDHSQGCSVTGGMIYRGAAIPDLLGTYFFADFCSDRVWSLKYNGAIVTNFVDRTSELNSTGSNLQSIVTFGEDHDGEIYLISVAGAIYKIVPTLPACGFANYCTANPTSVGPPASISALGSPVIAGNNFFLTADALPPATVGIFFYGPAQVQGPPSGIGNLCVTGNSTMPAIRMYPPIAASSTGTVMRHLDFTAAQQAMGPGAIVPGVTLGFQFWFRDNVNGIATWNFTDGLSAVFCP